MVKEKIMSYEKLHSFGAYENKKFGKTVSFPVDKPDQECFDELQTVVDAAIRSADEWRAEKKRREHVKYLERRARELDAEIERYLAEAKMEDVPKKMLILEQVDDLRHDLTEIRVELAQAKEKPEKGA